MQRGEARLSKVHARAREGRGGQEERAPAWRGVGALGRSGAQEEESVCAGGCPSCPGGCLPTPGEQSREAAAGPAGRSPGPRVAQASTLLPQPRRPRAPGPFTAGSGSVCLRPGMDCGGGVLSGEEGGV